MRLSSPFCSCAPSTLLCTLVALFHSCKHLLTCCQAIDKRMVHFRSLDQRKMHLQRLLRHQSQTFNVALYHWRAAKKEYKECENLAVDKDATLVDLDRRCESIESTLKNMAQDMQMMKDAITMLCEQAGHSRIESQTAMNGVVRSRAHFTNSHETKKAVPVIWMSHARRCVAAAAAAAALPCCVLSTTTPQASNAELTVPCAPIPVRRGTCRTTRTSLSKTGLPNMPRTIT